MTTKREAPGDVLELRTRALEETNVHLVRAEGEDAPKFTGYAAVYNSRTAIGDPLRWGFYEQIAPGAFDRSIETGDPRFLVDHDSRMVVARASAGDLRLVSDDRGLSVDADLDIEVSYVRDLVRNLEKRRITGMSFGFRVDKDEWEEIDVEVTDDQGRTATATVELRTLVQIQVPEISAVTFPAYEDTTAGLRSMVSDVRAARGRPAEAPTARGGERAAAAAAEHRRRREAELAARYLLPRQ